MWDDHISELLPAHHLQIVSSFYFCHLPCLDLDYQLFEYIEFIFLLARCASRAPTGPLSESHEAQQQNVLEAEANETRHLKTTEWSLK